MKNNKDKSILIFGLGESGKSTFKYFYKKYNIYIWDDKKKIRKNFVKNYNAKLKNFNEIIWDEIYFIILTPGISLKDKRLEIPIKKNIPIYRDLEFFSRKIDKDKVIAITGTNGKSTTLALISKILKNTNNPIFSGGNFKPPLLDALFKKKYFKYVLELSSFQLESAPSFNSNISILLNISEDHLERYGSIQNYAKIKKKIFVNSNKNQTAIIGVDDKFSKKIYSEIKKNKKNVIPISVNKYLKKGIYFNKNTIIDNYYKSKNLNIDNYKTNFILENNKMNVLATYAVLKTMNLKKDFFIKTLNKFKPLKHRSQIIHKSKNLIVINDSKATNLASTVHSVKSLNNIHLILGGKIKSRNYAKLIELKSHIRKIYIIGESANYLNKKLNIYFDCEVCKIMKTAIRVCLKDIKNYNFSTILLSPACSSYDQYVNFEDRGDQFINLFNKFVSK